jgi:hypothetical protein
MRQPVDVDSSAIDVEAAKLATWRGWAGEAESWPVTEQGRTAVVEAVEIHRNFFTDAWLTEMTKRYRHPFLSLYECVGRDST